jgi:DUF3060 family protein/pentapeptide repeat protein
MVRKWIAPTVGLVVLPVMVLTGCAQGQTSGTSSPPPVQNEAASDSAASPLSVPCAPGSGRAFNGSSPMNLDDLSGQQLDCAVFDDQTMNGVNLSQAKLSGAEFKSSTVNRTDFTRATMVGAVFEDSTLNSPDFSGADLRGADLRDAKLNGPVFTGATCPDGVTADDAGCADHLTPMATGSGSGAPDTSAETPADTPADTPTEKPAEPAPKPPTKVDAPDAPPIFNTSADGTYNCTGGRVLINGASSSLHLTGHCDLVIVNGAGSDVEVDSANRILVNGANAKVTYHGTSHVFVNGSGASAHRA